ncbi:MAG: T9SS type A sorting domain-containing protein [Patescibacteria group bacterium]|nr:T9SS type A sorting domain-containing protein [Patescibacteria group bacterium]
MKKILFFLVISAIAVVANAQVKSVTMIKAESLVDSAVITHQDSTVGATDTFYRRIAVANDVTFTSPFYTKAVITYGDGEYSDCITAPLVTTGVQSFVRVELSDDSLFANPLVSNSRIVKPREKTTLPSLTLLNKNPNTSGIVQKIKYTVGHCDSAIVTRIIALDQNFNYISNTKIWSKKLDGEIGDTIRGLKDEKEFFVKWIVANSMGTDTLQYSFQTLPINKPPWIKKQIDSIKITETTISFKGSVITYGLIGEVWASYDGIKSAKISTTGIGEENYSISLTGLNTKTNYLIKVFVKNSMGTDSFNAGKIQTKDPVISEVFTLKTSGANVYPSRIEVLGEYNIPDKESAEINCGVFAENDSNCTIALQAKKTIENSGIGQLVTEFDLETGTYWVWYWGTCSDGQFVLNPAPVKVIVKQTGIEEINEKSLVYPNPASNFIKVPSLGQYHIYDINGQEIKTGQTSGTIHLTELITGNYILKINNESYLFQIQK